jgi:hypothetical protein
LPQPNGRGWGPVAVFRLDYFSCLLTVVSTIMVVRKQWMGLVIAAINCVLVCVIGMRTAQYGFVPANLFCILTYAWSIRSWSRDRELSDKPVATPTVPAFPTTRARATTPLGNSRRSGLFLAYSASTCARMRRHGADELISANSIAEVKAGS